jgi:NAD(P)-dependent dehydrogenase (short-subunit alcohol dehydrogenase family)
MARVYSETVEGWERVMRINTTSAFLCYKYAAIQMVNQGRGGRIIGASSMVGKRGKAFTLVRVWRMKQHLL